MTRTWLFVWLFGLVSLLAAAEADMVRIDGGTFTIGGNTYVGKTESPALSPAHRVTLSGYSIAKFDVTVAEYSAFVKATGYRTTSEIDTGSHYLDPIHGWDVGPKYNWKNPGFKQTPSDPVVDVSWYDCIAFCNWKSQREGLAPVYSIGGKTDFTAWYKGWNSLKFNEIGAKEYNDVAFNFSANGYRLPTYAEWYFAARGGKSSKGFLYPGSNDVDSVAWYGENSGSRTHPVGQKKPNELGLFDMSGNVEQICWDCFDSLTDDDVINPTGPLMGLGLPGQFPSGSYLTDRRTAGGSWVMTQPSAVEASLNSEGYVDATDSASIKGFRLVKGLADKDTLVNKMTVPAKYLNSADPALIHVFGSTYRQEFVFQSTGLSRPVTVDSFWIGKTEITVKEFNDFVNATGYKTTAELVGKSWEYYGDGAWSYSPGASWKNPGFDQSENDPVVCVSWFDCIAFCSWKSSVRGLPAVYSFEGATDVSRWPAGWNSNSATEIVMDQKASGYRLPTRAEWEYAAQNGAKLGTDAEGVLHGGIYGSGRYGEHDGIDGWDGENSGMRTHPVAQKLPSYLGLYDTGGNASEWCWDNYRPETGSKEALTNPTGPAADPAKPAKMVLGGNWSSRWQDIFESTTGSMDTYFAPNASKSSIGFRIVCGE